MKTIRNSINVVLNTLAGKMVDMASIADNRVLTYDLETDQYYHADVNTLVSTAVTYEALLANGDIGTGATQVAQGDHLHDGRYPQMAAAATISGLWNFTTAPTIGGSAIWTAASFNPANYVPYSGAIGNVDLGGYGISADYYTKVKPKINVPINNLGNPTVEEMSLFHGQFSNKMRFFPATLQEESTDGINWVASTKASSDQLKDIMLGEGQGGGFTAIPGAQTGYYRLTWDAQGYCSLQSFYCYASANGNAVSVKLEKYNIAEGWTDIASGTIGGWPEHTYIPHTGVWFLANAPDQPHHGKVRVTFGIATPGTYGFDLYAIEWFGGYPAGRRNVEYYDRNQNVYFPTGIYASGEKVWTAGNDGAGSGLDADVLDGFQPDSTAAANTVVVRNGSGYIFGRYFNSDNGQEASAAASYLYDTGDGYFRKKSLANVKSEIVTSASVIAGLGYTPLSSFTETDTLATVTGRGATTYSALSLYATSNTEYGTAVVGTSGGPRSIFLAGQAGFSNGFTVGYNGTNMVYTMNSGNLTVGGDTTVTGTLNSLGQFIFESNSGSNYTEGIRLNLSTNGWAGAAIGGARGTTGGISGGWWLARNPSSDFVIAYNTSDQSGGLFLPASGTALTFKSQTILHSGNYSSYALPLSGGNITGDVSLSSGKWLSFVDQAGTYPTTQGGFKWTLNNDSASIYAFQPSSDYIDFVFALSDNPEGSSDRYVYKITSWQGSSYDKYPLIMSGVNFTVGAPFDTNQKAWFAYGSTSMNGYSWTDSAITTNSIEIVNSNGSSSNSPTLAFHWYGNGGPQFRLSNDGARILYLESAQANSARSGSSGGTTYFDSLRLLSSNSNGIYVNGNNVWHSGNDGAGSGLDADLIDGVHLSNLLRNDNQDQTSAGILRLYSNDASGNYHTRAIELREVSMVTTTQSAANYAPSIGFHWGGRDQRQIAMLADGTMVIRSDEGTGWAIIHAGNIGSQSVAYSSSSGNSDTIDGYHASSFVITGKTISGNIDTDYGECFITHDPVPAGTPPYATPNWRTINVGDNFGRRTQLAFPYDSDRGFFRRKYDATWQPWQEFITSGNIGSQSVNYAANSMRLYSADSQYTYGSSNPYFGFLTYNGTNNRWRFKVYPATPENVEVAYADDAGSVDGIDSSRIVYGDGATGKSTQTGNANDLSLASGFYFGVNATGLPTGDWWNFLTCKGNSWGSPDGYGYQLAVSFWSDDMRMRRLAGGGWNGWVTLAHSGNLATLNGVSLIGTGNIVIDSGTPVVTVAQTAHGFSVGNVIRVSGANTFTKAQANTSANAEVVGYVITVIDANNFKYVPSGYVIVGIPAVAAGTVLYLDPNTAGALTATEPTAVGQISKPLMVVVENGAKAVFNNFRGMEISAGDGYVLTSTTVNGKALSGNITLVIDSGDFSLSDNTTNNSNTSRHGLLPKLSGNQTDALRGDGTWGAVSSGSAFWGSGLGTPTRTSGTTFTMTGDYTAIFAKGLIIKWTESSTVRVAMVSIPSTYGSPNTTVTIIGDTMTSIDAGSLKYCLSGVEVFMQRFAVAGNISAAGTDIANSFTAMEPYRVIGSDIYVGTAGTTGTMSVDLNKNGTTMFTTKPSLATTAAYSPTPFTADSGSSLALGDKVTLDIDTVHTTAAIDLYVQLYLVPTRYLNL